MRSIGEILALWTRLVVRSRWLVIGSVLVLAALALRYAVANLGIDTDTADMISPELEWRRHFNDYRESFPARDRNLIVLVEAENPADAEALAQALALRLRAEPDVFASVFLAGFGEFFARNGLLYLSIDELEALADRLADAQPLLGLIRQDASAAGIVDVVTRTVDVSDASLGAEPLAELHGAVAEAFAAAAAGGSAPIDWRSLIRADAVAANPQVLVVQPALDFTRIRPARAAIDRLHAIEAELLAELDGPASIRLTGTLALEDEELDSVTSSAGLAGLLALLMVSVVLYWSLRSLRLIAVALVTLSAGLIGTASFAAAAVGHLNLLSVAFAVLYVGLGVDFILHITLRVKELLAAGSSMAAAVEDAMRGVGASLVVCTITTAAGFYSFVPTSFAGVSELGLISGTGMFISLFASATLLPALLVAVCSRDTVGPFVPSPAAVMRLGRLRPGWVVGTTLALVAAGAVSLPFVRFDSNPVNLRDPDAESVRALEALRSSNDADLLTLVALADDPSQAAAWVDELEALPEVESVVDLGSLVPDAQATKLALIEEIALILGPGFADLAAPASERDELLDALGELRAALVAAERTPAEDRLLAALERLLAALSAGDGEIVAALDRDLLSDLPARLESLQQALGAREFERADLPAELAARFIDPAGRALIEIVPRADITDNAAATQLIAAVRGIVPQATGLPVVYHEAAQTVVASFQLALTYAIAAVAVLLLLFLRSLGDSVLVLVPITAAALITAGFTVWLDIPFNFANIIALPLLVGVGVDHAIHVVHRSRTEPSEQGGALNTSTSLAVLASALTTIASFGNLAFSTHRGMASMGTLLTIGMVTTTLATLAFLSALLQLRARR